MLLVCDNETLGTKVSSAIDLTGEIIAKNGGIYKRYYGMQSLVNDVIDALC